MRIIRIILVSMMLANGFGGFSQDSSNIAQSTETVFAEVSDSAQTDETTATKKKKDKTKKDKIELDKTFYMSLGINLLAVLILVIAFHYRNYRKQEVFFTYLIFNITIFLLTYLLNEVKISMGAAFGLFAVFSMLRYRTEGISMKDMTYLFIVIAMGLIAAVQLEIKELIIIDSIIILTTMIFEGKIFFKNEGMKKVRYDNIDLVKPEKNAELIADLESRTGLKINRVEVKNINFLKDTARIVIFYKS